MQSNYHKLIETPCVNRENPRTSFVSHDNKEEAIINVTNFEKSPYYINLNGKWQFYFNEDPSKVPEDIATNTNQNDPNWSEIIVPGNWERQGYGIAVYTDGTYDFCPNDPQPPYLPKNNPIGVYRRKDVSIPQNWVDTERNIYLQIGGAKTGVYVYVNGQEVGYSEDSKDPADYLINKFVHPGNDNVVTFLVYKYCTGSYLEDQDMWRLGGIERDVFLYSQPKIHIQDFHVVSTLDDEYKSGVFKLLVNVDNHDQTGEVEIELSFELIDTKSGNNSIIIQNQKSTKIKPNKDEGILFDNVQIPDIRHWSAEHPNLYLLLLTLKKKSDNSILEIVPFRVGFRREEIVEIKQNDKKKHIFLFNGKPIKFKGVNIHEHDQITGHYVTDEVRLKDIELLKQNNFNALRFSHYPNCRRFYELCDEYGFYVVSECNIESHGMGFEYDKTLANKKIWFNAHMDRTKNNYERTKNHACVTIYSLGNEAGNGINMYETYKYLKENEKGAQNRPINYEGAHWENNTDMYFPMYPSDKELGYYNELENKPCVCCEYSHSMGNSEGGLNRLWNVINNKNYLNIQGGFIWDWVDQGFFETGKGGRMFWAYGGDYGYKMPSDGNRNINGILNPDRNPHPAMAEVKYCQQNIGFEIVDIEKGIFNITNRFYFTNLNEFEILCSFFENEKKLNEINLSNKHNELASLKPQESFTVDLHNEIDKLKPKINTKYFLNFKVIAKTNNHSFIPIGFEVAHDQFKLKIESIPKTEKHEEGPKLSIFNTEKSVTVSSQKVEFVFDKKDGFVNSYKIDGFQYIKNGFGFRPNFWRGPTDNDYGNGFPDRNHFWKERSRKFKIKSIETAENDNSVILTVIYTLLHDSDMNIEFKIVYCVFSCGIIKVDLYYTYSTIEDEDENEDKDKDEDKDDDDDDNDDVYLDADTIPRIGFRFHLPPELHNVVYFGRGPEENYTDRCSGTQIGLYKTTAEDLYYPYVRPQENGHHVDTRWLSFDNDSKSNGLLISADKLIEFNALRNTVEDFDDEEQKELPYQLNYFGCDECQDGENVLKRQHHVDDVVPRDFVEVNIDLKQEGVAGFNCWGDRAGREYSLQVNLNYELGFTLIPFVNEDEIHEKLNHFYS